MRWVKFVVGSRLAPKVFLSVLGSGFPPSTKNISKLHFDQNRGPAWKFTKANVASSLNDFIYLFIYIFIIYLFVYLFITYVCSTEDHFKVTGDWQQYASLHNVHTSISGFSFYMFQHENINIINCICILLVTLMRRKRIF